MTNKIEWKLRRNTKRSFTKKMKGTLFAFGKADDKLIRVAFFEAFKEIERMNESGDEEIMMIDTDKFKKLKDAVKV